MLSQIDDIHSTNFPGASGLNAGNQTRAARNSPILRLQINNLKASLLIAAGHCGVFIPTAHLTCFRS